MLSHSEREIRKYYLDYIVSGLTKAEFCKKTKIGLRTLQKAKEHCNFPEELMTADPMKEPEEMDNSELMLEIVRLKQEKKALEKKLDQAEVKVKVNEMLIDMAESKYHIKVRKNSDAK